MSAGNPGSAAGADARPRILVVDDNVLNRRMLQSLLEHHGFQVTQVEGGRQALEEVESSPPDLILLDLMMPEVDGFQVLTGVRKSFTPSALPVLMATASDSDEDVVRALELGANDYVTKPINRPVVLARVRSQLARAEAERALRQSEQRFALAAQGARDGIWDWDLAADRIYFSPRWEAMLGIPEGGLGHEVQAWTQRIHPRDRQAFDRALGAHVAGETEQFDHTYRIRHSDGSHRWFRTRGESVRDASGQAIRLAGSQTDVNDSFRDRLTGLATDVLFRDRLDEAIELLLQDQTASFGVLLFDIDDFDRLKNRIGYRRSEALLKLLAQRLERGVAEATTELGHGVEMTLARHDTSEFLVLLENLPPDADLTSCAAEIQAVLSEPCEIEGRPISVPVSVALLLSNRRHRVAEEVLTELALAVEQVRDSQVA
ncbi:MAG: response regulator [Acidobacteriota bacterium]